MKLNEKLAHLRKKKGLSQLKLAEKMNVSRQAISRWEVGAAAPSTENLKYLGFLYDVPLEYLLNDNAPEPSRMDRDAGKKNKEEPLKKHNRNGVLVLIAIGILVVVFCAMFFSNRDKETIPMGDIEGSDMETENEFDLEW